MRIGLDALKQFNAGEKIMTTLQNQIEKICITAFTASDFDTKFAVVRESDRPDLTDFQCNGALAVAKSQKRNPMEVAQEVVTHMSGNELFDVDIAKPGFLNFRVREDALMAHLAKVAGDPRSLVPLAEPGQKFLVDYGGPNVAKEMHVGHLRSSIIGQALKTILRFAGHEADGDVHLGDWGLQMGQVICYVEDHAPEYLDSETALPISMTDLQVWYPAASGLSKTDEAFRDRARAATQALQAGQNDYYNLWTRIRDASVESLKRDYDWLGVDFEFWFGESRYQAALEPLVKSLTESGVAELDDGAVIIRTSDDGKLPPLIMQNSNGGFGYGATDVATLQERAEDPNLNTVLYVVDARQSMHFKQVFSAAEQAGLFANLSAEHCAFGTVNGTDGKPFKTRAGGTMRLADLITMMSDAVRSRLDEANSVDANAREFVAAQIAKAAIKFGELSHDREKDYVFNVDQFAQFEGKTGPYIQYTCVRIGTLLANAQKDGLKPSSPKELGEGGRALTLALDAFPAALARTVTSRKPNFVANHAYRLAECTNGFYQKNRVLSAGVSPQEASSRLGVLNAARQQLVLCLELMGIDVPEQM